MRSTPKMFRQGDVLLIAIASALVGARNARRDRGRIVLAYGEVTGHAHAVRQRGANLTVLEDRVSMGEAARQLLAECGLTTEIRDEEVVGVLDVAKGAVVEHEEHASIALDEGRYLVLRQREYSPESIQTVAD